MISRLLLSLALALAAATQAGAQQTTWPPLGGRQAVPPYAFYTQPHAYLGQVSQPICQLTAGVTVNSDGQTCRSNPKAGVGYQAVTLTGVSTLALPTNLPANGGLSILFQITHSGTDGPTLAGGFQTPGGAQPPECNGTTIVTGCWSTTSGLTDWLPCVSINASNIGCGSVITNVAKVPPIAIAQTTAATQCPAAGSGDGTGGTTCSSATLTLTSGNDLIIATGFCVDSTCVTTPSTLTVNTLTGTNLTSCAFLTHNAASALMKSELWRCHVSSTGATHAALTWSSNAFFAFTYMWEVAGLAASPDDGVGATASGTGITPTAALTGGGATQGDGELVVTTVLCNLDGEAVSGTGWVQEPNGTGRAAHKFTTATGAQTPTISCPPNTGSNPWTTSIAALKH